MKEKGHYSIEFTVPALKFLGLTVILFFFLVPASFAQNTKGDQPAPKTRQARESRFKVKSKQGDRARTKDIAGRRLRTKNKSSANRANANYKQPNTARKQPRQGNDKVGKANRAVSTNRPSEEQRAWKGNAAGKRVNVRSATGRTRNVYPQKGRFVNNPSHTPKDPQQRMNAVSSRRVTVKSQSGKIRNVYPQKRKRVSASRAYLSHRSINPFAGFWNKKQKGERAYKGDISGRKMRTKNFETQRLGVIKPSTNPYYGRKRVGDRPYKGQAAGSYKSRTQSGRAWSGDIAGRKIRGRNFSSKKFLEVRGRAIFPPQKTRTRKGDTPYKGPSGGFRSASQPGEKRAGKSPIPVRSPGRGADNLKKYQGNMRVGKFFRPQGEEYSGNLRGRKGVTPQGGDYRGTMKSRKLLRGGGSVSGKLWNNQGRAISGRTLGKGAERVGTWQGNMRYSRKGFLNQGEEYSGNLKARKSLQGGGSVSGQLWNNQGRATSKRTLGKGAARAGTWQGNMRYSKKGFLNQGEEYSGNIKARKLLQGGGSASGKLWNNQGRAISGRTFGKGAERVGNWQGNIRYSRKGFLNQGEEYSGNIRTRKPLQGGGSVSGKLWNNQGRAISGRVPGQGAEKMGTWQGNIRYAKKAFSNRGEDYAGSIKARKPLKGGGSTSGKLWNNNQTPLSGKAPKSAEGIGYSGRVKLFDLKPSLRNQGEEYTGHLKTRRPLKGGGSVSGKLWNNEERPIQGKIPGKEYQKIGYSGNIKAVKKEPSKEVGGFPGKYRKFDLRPSMHNQGEEFTGYVRLSRFKKNYVKNPNSSEEALRTARPDKSTYHVDNIYGRVKSYKTKRNPSSSDDALKAREPGKAFAREVDYQGNIKMKKFNLFGKKDLHPDAQFVKTNKNNVKEERDMLTNFKLWWARLFRKNETQPDNLKEKYRKPRYDKREQGLWYD